VVANCSGSRVLESWIAVISCYSKQWSWQACGKSLPIWHYGVYLHRPRDIRICKLLTGERAKDTANIRHCFSQGRWVSFVGLRGRWLTGVAGSKPDGGMDICLLWVLCVWVWSWNPITKRPYPTKGCRTKQGWKIFNIYCFNYDHVILGSPKQRSPHPLTSSGGDSNILKLAPVSLLIEREARTFYCSRNT